ncbi:hypothetical protein A0U40_05230 [[Bacillus] sp. KCTC 13219]|nr:hypothetical protein A0U40_05230 [[Bacillus] sp. KCTC 13219]
MLPKITELEFNKVQLSEDLPPIGKSFLYDFDKGQFVLVDGGMVELHGIESLKMWIMKILKTERFRFRVYNDVEYGVTLEELIGSNLPRAFVEAEIKREVTTSLLLHTHISAIEKWDFERDGKWMYINFRVITPEGAFKQEVMFSV